MIEKQITRTLLLAPSNQKWSDYQNHFQEFFAGRWPIFDRFLAHIAEFFAQHGSLPSHPGIASMIQAANDEALHAYITAVAADNTLPIHRDPVDFVAALHSLRNRCYRFELVKATQEFQGSMDGHGTYVDVVHQKLDVMLADLFKAQERALGSDAPDVTSLIGLEAQQVLRDDYEALKTARNTGEIFYTLPFAALHDVQIKRGDLLFVGAYSSQGKSLLLRVLADHLVTKFGLNVAFWTLETSGKSVRTLASLAHANNKRIFPNTPKVPVAAYKTARLTAEQEDYLLSVANKDLTENPCYGTLIIEQPSKALFTLDDLTQRLAVMQHTKMEPDVLVIDQINNMSPVPPGRLAPVRSDDYNLMIRQLKRLCLTHRAANGQPRPLICLAAAQISRRAYYEALKQDCCYDLGAFSTYTDIERSADIALTALMTPEMRHVGHLKLQVQKNRDGAVPTEPLLLHVDFDHGSRATALTERTQEQVLNAIRTLRL